MNKDLVKRLYLLLILLFLAHDSFAAENQPDPTYVVFRIDDLGIDNFSVYPKIIPLFQKYHIPLTIGVVPFKGDGDKCESTITSEIRRYLLPYILNGEIEIALHGYSHRNLFDKKKIYSEFYGVDSLEQYSRILKGKTELERIFQTPVSTFIPPWNTYDDATTTILNTLGFSNISGARYGSIGYKEANLNYIPYTTTINNLNDILDKIGKTEIQKDEHVMVVLFHAYDLEISNKYHQGYKSDGPLTLSELENMLETLKLNKNIFYLTINELGNQDIDFGANRLKKNHLGKFILPLPSLLKPRLSFYYKNYGSFSLLTLQYAFPIAYYIFFMIVGFSTGKILNKFISSKILLQGVYGLMVIGIVACFLLIIFGKLNVIGIITEVVLLTSVSSLSAFNLRNPINRLDKSTTV